MCAIILDRSIEIFSHSWHIRTVCTLRISKSVVDPLMPGLYSGKSATYGGNIGSVSQEVNAYGINLYGAAQQLMGILDQYIGQLKAIADCFKSLAVKLLFIIGFFMMTVMAMVTILVVKSIIRPLRVTVAFAKSLSQGELTQMVSRFRL